MSLEITPYPTAATTDVINWIANAKKFAPANELGLFSLQSAEGSQLSLGLGFDWDFLYIQVNAPFRAKPTGSRSWRSGDGLMVTASPNLSESSQFISLGFGGSAKEPQVVLVNSSGSWFPKLPLNDVRYRLTASEKGSEYKLAIPWNLLAPIRPLPLNGLGLNVTFVRSGAHGRNFYQLVPDEHYDTELTNQRKVLPLGFAPVTPKSPKAQTVLTQARWLGREPLQLNLGVFSPGSSPAELLVSICSKERELERYSFAMELAPGLHRWVIRWSPHRRLAPGLYNLKVEGKGGPKDYVKDHPFLVMDPKDREEITIALGAMENDIKILPQDAVHTGLAMLAEIEQFVETPPWEVSEKPLELLRRGQAILEALRAGRNPLESDKGLSRRAFRSKLDGSLQPYSLYLPKAYSPEKRWPVLVLLHGSGVDDQQFSTNPEIHRLAERLGVVVIMPLGRDKSGWYLGDCETDIFDAISAAKASLSLDWSRIYLAGFSMGGFGTWHTGLRHSRQFAGLGIISGLPSHPFDPSLDFSPRKFVDRAKTLPILVVHGTQDDAVPIGPTREVVEFLQEEGADITWREMAKAGHGNFDWPGELGSWLKQQLRK